MPTRRTILAAVLIATGMGTATSCTTQDASPAGIERTSNELLDEFNAIDVSALRTGHGSDYHAAVDDAAAAVASATDEETFNRLLAVQSDDNRPVGEADPELVERMWEVAQPLLPELARRGGPIDTDDATRWFALLQTHPTSGHDLFVTIAHDFYEAPTRRALRRDLPFGRFRSIGQRTGRLMSLYHSAVLDYSDHLMDGEQFDADDDQAYFFFLRSEPSSYTFAKTMVAVGAAPPNLLSGFLTNGQLSDWTGFSDAEQNRFHRAMLREPRFRAWRTGIDSAAGLP